MMTLVGTVSSADGSSLVRVGQTHVVCGIKLEIGKPTDMEPRAGRLGSTSTPQHTSTPLHHCSEPHYVDSGDSTFESIVFTQIFDWQSDRSFCACGRVAHQ